MSWRQLGSPQHEELRRLLVDRRQRAGLTQKEVAERLDRTQRFISRVEAGSHRVTVVELIEFGLVLDFDPTAVLRQVMKRPALELPLRARNPRRGKRGK
ncbi:MAG: helix-turn-helix transcriptional regulator [Bradyrhizobiaceae bacterium]|nr:helix-turn-helix transcriptional regulator [Bradyrhizobiaceae bacterium]